MTIHDYYLDKSINDLVSNHYPMKAELYGVGDLKSQGKTKEIFIRLWKACFMCIELVKEQKIDIDEKSYQRYLDNTDGDLNTMLCCFEDIFSILEGEEIFSEKGELSLNDECLLDISLLVSKALSIAISEFAFTEEAHQKYEQEKANAIAQARRRQGRKGGKRRKNIIIRNRWLSDMINISDNLLDKGLLPNPTKISEDLQFQEIGLEIAKELKHARPVNEDHVRKLTSRYISRKEKKDFKRNDKKYQKEFFSQAAKNWQYQDKEN